MSIFIVLGIKNINLLYKITPMGVSGIFLMLPYFSKK